MAVDQLAEVAGALLLRNSPTTFINEGCTVLIVKWPLCGNGRISLSAFDGRQGLAPHGVIHSDD